MLNIDVIKINGYHYHNFTIDENFLNKYVKFEIKNGMIFIFQDKYYNKQFLNKYCISKMYNNILKKNENILNLKKLKLVSNFHLERNNNNEWWICDIKSSNNIPNDQSIHSKESIHLKDIMNMVDEFFKNINYVGIAYISDWSYINNVRTLDYRLLLNKGSIYKKYGFKLVYEIPDEYKKIDINPIIKDKLLDLYNKKIINKYNMQNLVYSNKYIVNYLDHIIPFYSFMFKLYL